MKLREWANKQGISYRTALRWFHGGTLPVDAEQIATGTILVKLDNILEDQKAALYARVSSSDQKTNLDFQIARLTHFAFESNLSIASVVTEVGSAMNGKRPKLLKLLQDRSIRIIVVEQSRQIDQVWL